MADTPVAKNSSVQPPVGEERESVLDMLRKRQQEKIDPEREAKATEEFDQDFKELTDIVDEFTHVGGVVVTDTGLVLDVDGILVKRIILRKIPQDLRFDADENYPRTPRYELVIEYNSDGDGMADKLIVDFEEFFKKPISQTIAVIKERILEAKRESGIDVQNGRVWAIHDEIHKKGGGVEHTMRSDGKGVQNKRDYDGRVQVEIENAIDAIRSAIALKQATERIKTA